MKSKLAYLRGTGIELVVHQDSIPGLKVVAKSLGLRRLMPVHGDSLTLCCAKCGKEGSPNEMLADLDGKPYHSYEHKECPPDFTDMCTGCGELKGDVERRYSFGVYAGRLCMACAHRKYRDHCGISLVDGVYTEDGVPQGSPADLDEPYYED